MMKNKLTIKTLLGLFSVIGVASTVSLTVTNCGGKQDSRDDLYYLFPTPSLGYLNTPSEINFRLAIERANVDTIVDWRQLDITYPRDGVLLLTPKKNSVDYKGTREFYYTTTYSNLDISEDDEVSELNFSATSSLTNYPDMPYFHYSYYQTTSPLYPSIDQKILFTDGSMLMNTLYGQFNENGIGGYTSILFYYPEFTTDPSLERILFSITYTNRYHSAGEFIYETFDVTDPIDHLDRDGIHWNRALFYLHFANDKTVQDIAFDSSYYGVFNDMHTTKVA